MLRILEVGLGGRGLSGREVGSLLPVLSPLRPEEELSSHGVRNQPVKDSESSWKGERAACFVLPSLWDPRGVLKGVKFSALEVLETQGLPGEVSSVWWQRTSQKFSIPVIQERVQETKKGAHRASPSPKAGIQAACHSSNHFH